MNVKIVIIVIAILSAVVGVWFLGVGVEDERAQVDLSEVEDAPNIVSDSGTTSEVLKTDLTKSVGSPVILEADTDDQFPKSTAQELEAAIRAVDEFTENNPPEKKRSNTNLLSVPIDAMSLEEADFEVEKSSEKQLQEAIQEVEDKRAILNAQAK